MSKQSTPDPVAEKSGFLRMYMSGHPDTLVAYAKWFGKVQEVITSAEMTAIDTKSMTLTCTLKNCSKKEVYIPIEPPLRGYEDVKPRLLEMKALAQEGLGMIKAPQITTFEVTRDIGISAAVMLSAAYLAYSPENSPSPLFYAANSVQQFVGAGVIRLLVNITFSLHALEALYTLHLCRKHHTGFGVGSLYVASTFLCGFAVCRNLRRRIQAARIDSVMKVE
ncbi:hypothetical protein D9756_010290 [Leucocoprinus leucothites]|uniref:DUF2470 domain-containing protein n=1 Tax=Leucocoprinus leucothites TaxID=201217 RepID=A0A8H5CTJ5_9AGAR|nr:hypothetical protein D9756_010290 [Leucoagaricus leucothites]